MMELGFRVLAVDPGDKRIGIALSDESGTIANPFGVVKHISRPADAGAIITIALEQQVKLIVIGCSMTCEGQISFQGRKSVRLQDAIQKQSTIPAIIWDESGTTQIARQTKIEMNVKRQNRKGHLDDLAATVLLQSYLDSQIAKEKTV